MTDPVPVWKPGVSLPAAADVPLPGRITHLTLHRGDAGFAFLHESAIVRHRQRFIVAWNNSPRAESERGSVVRWIGTDDGFASWSAPAVLAPPLEHETTIWESAQLLSVDGVLWAFVGQVHSQPRVPEETGGRTVIFRFDDKSGRWEPCGAIDNFHPLNRPQHTPAGNWIMGGQFNLVRPHVALSRGGDLTQWEVVEIPSAPEHRINFAETSLIVAGDAITAFVRTATPWLHTAESRDGGRSWRPLAASNLPMSSSKTCAGLLSTGQRYLAFNMPPADNAGPRDTLAVAVSAPGEPFLEKLVLIRRGPSPAPRLPGFCKAPQWSYPSVEEYAGHVYITYTATKEDCCLSVLPLGEFAIEM